MTDEEIIQVVRSYKLEAQQAKRTRQGLNDLNRAAYMNQQDWSEKIEGQSTEFLPKVSETAEQFAAFIKRGLIQFGDWFSVESESEVLDNESIRKIIMCYLDKLPDGIKTVPFSVRMSDAIKTGLLESLMIFKIHGETQSKKFFTAKDDDVETIELNPWRLQIELIPFEDYDLDPTGNNLYEIHTVEKDLHHVIELAEQGVYDKDAVSLLESATRKTEEERKDPQVPKQGDPTFRKKVVLEEFWGVILNDDGTVFKKEQLVTIANDKYILRKADFPFWHGESPFVVAPIIRVPFTVYHRALYDQVTPLNNALNELFNLMLDGGIASVWGIKQIHMDWLEDPRQVSGGIAQGKTLAVNENMPDGGKVLEQVTEGQIPPDAMNMFSILDRELNSSALSNELRQGLLPSKQVKATEVVEASQSASVLLDSITKDVEAYLEDVIRKSWFTILQNADSLLNTDLRGILNDRQLLALARMSPAERFQEFANTCSFKVYGLSSTLSRARDFSKLMAILQLAGSNPLVMSAFMRKMSPDKWLAQAMKLLNLNPEDLQRDENEQGNVQEDMAFLQQFAGGNQGRVAGEPGLQSEVNQETQGTGGV